MDRGFPLAIALLWIGSLAAYAMTQADAGTAGRASRPPTPTRAQPVHTGTFAALARTPGHPSTSKRPLLTTTATPTHASISSGAGISKDRLKAAVADYPPHAIRTKPGLAYNPPKRAHPPKRAGVQQVKAPSVTPRPPVPTVPAHTLQVWVTGYDLYGTTATGVSAGPGICAVDPYTIPLGTEITIAGVGSCEAADTGPTVIGAHIDVWVPDYQTALNLTGWYTASW